MMEAAKEHDWNLNYGGIALMWRGGCIIRSRFLGDIKKAFDNNPSLENLLLDPFFKEAVEDAQESWRRVCYRTDERHTGAGTHFRTVISMASVANDCRQTCYRHNVTISVPTSMSVWIETEVNSSIPTGQVMEVILPPPPMMCNDDEDSLMS